MKKRHLCILLIFALAFTALTALPILADNTPTTYVVGTTIEGHRARIDQWNASINWYVVEIESDGLFIVSTTSRSTLQGRDPSTNWIDFFSGDGNTQIANANPSGRGYVIIPGGFNAFEDAWIMQYAIFLHRGTYLIRTRGGTGYITYSLHIERMATPYGEDAENNDTAAGAASFPLNGQMGGTVGGARDDGSIDRQDFFAVNIPAPMTTTFSLVSDRAPVNFAVLDSDGRYVTSRFETTSHNALLGRFVRDVSVTFENAGTYFLRVVAQSHGGIHPQWTPYQITMGDGTGTHGYLIWGPL